MRRRSRPLIPLSSLGVPGEAQQARQAFFNLLSASVSLSVLSPAPSPHPSLILADVLAIGLMVLISVVETVRALRELEECVCVCVCLWVCVCGGGTVMEVLVMI